jgi:hypothetical protein
MILNTKRNNKYLPNQKKILKESLLKRVYLERFTAILIRLKNNQFLLIASIYFPANRQQLDEILILESKINEILNDIPIDTYTILAGDWNNVFNPTLDRSHSVNTYTSTRPEHRLLTRLTSLHRRIPLIDIYYY